MSSLIHFLFSPIAQKFLSVKVRIRKVLFYFLALLRAPIRLHFGAWWFLRNDWTSYAVFIGEFDQYEFKFAENFLRPGMVAIDIGAHHGIFTLLAAKRVGKSGRVIAFEPSPRELKALLFHVKINRLSNVSIEPFAVANSEGKEDFFVCMQKSTGCNSLRAPQFGERLVKIPVSVKTLDGFARGTGLENVDMVKIDAEGAELEILQGASFFFQRNRPIVLCEIAEKRTRIWGYHASQLLDPLLAYGYKWFEPTREGRLRPLISAGEIIEGNFIAVAQENLAWINDFLER